MPEVLIGGVPFGRAWNAAGARNFFGEGYRFHRLLGPLGPDFDGSTFVAKTTTLHPRVGNMPLRVTDPVEFKPSCIKVNFRKAAVLNAVGLSGPGLKALLDDGWWSLHYDPFLLSFTAVGETAAERLLQAKQAAKLIAAKRSGMAPFGIELNLSCPNVGHSSVDFVADADRQLEAFDEFLPGVPLLPKFNVLVDPVAAARVCEHPACAGIVCSNTLPWGALPDRVDWEVLFGKTSPLAHLGGGGLSGAPLTDIVLEWVEELGLAGVSKPVVACGGVMTPRDAMNLFDAGASAVEVGSVAIVRPWRVRKIIAAVNKRFS